jgi:uncharacterized membrane protein YbhN (UPF0104 family)
MHATAFVAEGSSRPHNPSLPLKWKFVCVGITVAALYLVFRRVSVAALVEAVRTMRAGWFLGAMGIYGLMFLPAAWRWRLALRATDGVARFPGVVRFTVIGHFFYLLLFGGAGGDAAKAAMYARRYKLDIPHTLASVSLDRLMGSGALILIAAAAFGVTAFYGDFAGVKSLSVRGSGWWLVAMVPLAGVAILWLKRSRRESVAHRFAKAFLASGKRLLKSPKTLLKGLLCSLLMQLAINGALALNLRAVSHAPIPWLRLAWTFPLITAASGLPVTVAGIGARDGAAIALLGSCGVAVADAEATSLLTLCVSVFWGLAGGLILWRESNAPAGMQIETSP